MLDTAPVVATSPGFEAVFRDAFAPMVRALTVASGSRAVAGHNGSGHGGRGPG